MLKVWGRRSAYNVQKVLWAIGELGLAYEHIDVGGSRGQLDTPEFLAMNPHGRIPVIVDGRTSIWESNSIIRYLARPMARDRYGRKRPRRGLSPTAGWTGSSPACSPIFYRCSGGFSGRPLNNTTRTLFNTPWPDAKNIFVNWTHTSTNNLTWRAPRLPWRTSHVPPRFIVTSKWGRPC